MSVQTRFRARLEDALRVHVDARVLAFHLLGDARYVQLTRLLFAGLKTGAVRGQASAISLYQILAEPYRRGHRERAEEVAKRLTVVQGLEYLPVTSEIAAQGAEVRAQLGGRAERAIQIATALAGGADLYLTEGSGLRRIAGISFLNLEDFA